MQPRLCWKRVPSTTSLNLFNMLTDSLNTIEIHPSREKVRRRNPQHFVKDIEVYYLQSGSNTTFQAFAIIIRSATERCQSLNSHPSKSQFALNTLYISIDVIGKSHAAFSAALYKCARLRRRAQRQVIWKQDLEHLFSMTYIHKIS